METICFNNINWLSEFEIVDSKADDTNIKDIIPDSLTTNCLSCRLKFTSFLNRPNRCDVCGNLFCNSCIYKLKIKFCKYCFRLCQKFNKVIENNLIQTIECKKTFLEMKETYYCKQYHLYETSCKQFFSNENNSFESSLIENKNDTYELIMKALINYALKINFDDENIISEWKNIIYILIKETLSNLRPSFRYLSDSLDINNFIKIKIIPYKDTSLCQVIQGYVLHNKKKVKNIKNNIENPKILLLDREIDTNGKNKNKQKEKNENININKDIQIYYLKLIEYKLGLIKPDIIIFGKNFSKEIIDIIINNNFYDISVIYDIDNKVMKKLSRCFQTLILPSFKLIGSNSILGICKNFYIQKFSIISENNKNINENNKEVDKNIEYKTIENNNDNSNDLYSIFLSTSLLFSFI